VIGLLFVVVSANRSVDRRKIITIVIIAVIIIVIIFIVLLFIINMSSIILMRDMTLTVINNILLITLFITHVTSYRFINILVIIIVI